VDQYADFVDEALFQKRPICSRAPFQEQGFNTEGLMQRLHRFWHVPPVRSGEEIGSPIFAQLSQIGVRHIFAEYGDDMIAQRVILAVVNLPMRVDRDGQIAVAAVGTIRVA
jgi:hypothetical protein